jgi:hypothetical protein
VGTEEVVRYKVGVKLVTQMVLKYPSVTGSDGTEVAAPERARNLHPMRYADKKR